MSDPKRRIEAVDGVYFFYQAGGGQRVFLHPLCMRCLLEECGDYTKLPSTLVGRVEDLEHLLQSEELRKRHRPLEHLPLSCEFALAEVDMAPLVSRNILKMFAGKFKERCDMRKKEARKEAAAKQRAEREERKRREAREAVPDDMLTGPSLMESMAVAQYAIDDDGLAGLLAEEGEHASAAEVEVSSHQQAQNWGVLFGGGRGPALEEVRASTFPSPPPPSPLPGA